jgi:biotin carboxyl carrier protein
MKDFSLKINGQNYNVQIDDVNESSTLARVIVNGTAYEVEIDGGKTVAAKKPQVTPVPAAAASAASVTPATAAPSPRIAAATPTSGYSVKSPLPGTVLSIKVAVGDKVAAGQTLLILEAMKMENNIDAERGGVVKQILAQPNATVMEGDTLIVIE